MIPEIIDDSEEVRNEKGKSKMRKEKDIVIRARAFVPDPHPIALASFQKLSNNFYEKRVRAQR